jgi:hypothetical protein
MQNPQMLTPAELAERWRVSEAALRKWRSTNVGPGWFKLGHQKRNAPVRYPMEGILKFEASGAFGNRKP